MTTGKTIPELCCTLGCVIHIKGHSVCTLASVAHYTHNSDGWAKDTLREGRRFQAELSEALDALEAAMAMEATT